jgi:hypothetical protein
MREFPVTATWAVVYAQNSLRIAGRNASNSFCPGQVMVGQFFEVLLGLSMGLHIIGPLPRRQWPDVPRVLRTKPQASPGRSKKQPVTRLGRHACNAMTIRHLEMTKQISSNT